MKRLYVSYELLEEKTEDYFENKTAEDYNNDTIGDGDYIDEMLIRVDDMGNVNLYSCELPVEEQSELYEMVAFNSLENYVSTAITNYKQEKNEHRTKLLNEIKKLENDLNVAKYNANPMTDFNAITLREDLVDDVTVTIQKELTKELGLTFDDNQEAYEFVEEKTKDAILNVSLDDILSKFVAIDNLKHYVYVLECELSDLELGL